MAIKGTQNNSTIIKYTLIKPVTIDGTLYSEIELDFDSLNGEDILAVEQEMQASGRIVLGISEMNKSYLLFASARAAKLNANILLAFSAKDVSKITSIAQTFLMAE